MRLLQSVGLGQALRAVAYQADSGCVLRALDELHDTLDANREPEPNGHPEDLFGTLDHPFHQGRPAGEHTARTHLFQQARLFDAASCLAEDFLDPGLDDIAEQPSGNASWCVATHPGDLNLLVV